MLAKVEIKSYNYNILKNPEIKNMKKLFTLAAVAAFSIHSYAQDVADNVDFSDENPLAVQTDASRKNVAAWPAFFAIGDLPETPDLVGLRITIPWSTKQESVTGFDVGLWARTQFFEGFAFNVFRNDVKDELTGVQIGLYNSAAQADALGLQVGLWNEVGTMNGLQVGIVNTVGAMGGFQVGIINRAEELYGFQVGVVNVIRDAEMRFCPLINIGF